MHFNLIGSLLEHPTAIGAGQQLSEHNSLKQRIDRKYIFLKLLFDKCFLGHLAVL